MGKSSFFGPETIALHSGHHPDSDYGSRAVPIYQTTSYVFESVDAVSYTHLTLPTICSV